MAHGRNTDLRCLHGSFAEHGEVLQHDAQIGIGSDHLLHILEGPRTEAAIVVEELDDGNVAIGVAENDVVPLEQEIMSVSKDLLALRLLAFALALLQCCEDIAHHIRVLDKIFMDDRTDRLSVARIDPSGIGGGAG